MAYGFNDDRSKAEMYTKDEVYSKNEVYKKTEVYSKDEVYKKTETYPKTKLYNKDEIDDLLTDASNPAKQGSGYAICSTAAATAAKTATLTDYELVKNGYVSVCFVNGVTDITTLNINNKGAKNVYVGNNKNVIPLRNIKAGDIATFVYDGTAYRLVSLDRDDKEDIGQENADLIAAELTRTLTPDSGNFNGTVKYDKFGDMVIVYISGTLTRTISGLVSFQLTSNAIPTGYAPSAAIYERCRTLPNADIWIRASGGSRVCLMCDGLSIPSGTEIKGEIAYFV